MTFRRQLLLAIFFASSLVVPASAAEFKVDPTHSSVVFRVKHMNASYAYGRFNALAGSFTIDETDPAKSSFPA